MKRLISIILGGCVLVLRAQQPIPADSLPLYELEGVSIFDHPLPDTVWSSSERHVDDLVFLGSHLVLLTATEEQRWKRTTQAKSHLLKNAQIVIIDSTRAERVFPLVGNEFRLRTFNDTLLAVVGRASVHWIHGDSLDGFKSFTMPINDYEKYWSRIGWWSDTKVFFSDYSEFFPVAHYYLHNVSSNLEPELVYEVRDEWTHEVMRSEFKYLSGPDKVVTYQYELDHGIDKEYVAAYMRGFTQSNYFRSLNVHWANSGDGVVLLDQLQDRLVKWNYNGFQTLSVPWKRPVLKHLNKVATLMVDAVSHKVYFSFNVYPHTLLFEVDLQSGESRYVQTLFFSGVERAVVHDGKCFYIYRPFGADQKKYLYSEQLLLSR